MTEPEYEQNGNSSEDDAGSEWVGIGIAVGAGLGIAIGAATDETALGLAIGISLDVATVSAMSAFRKRSSGDDQ